MEALNWLDYLILVVITLSAIFSFLRGFVLEAISLVTWILAFWVSVRFMEPTALLFQEIIKTEPLRLAAAFLSLFVFILLLGALFKIACGRWVKQAELGSLDRFLGLIFGVLRGSMIIIAVLFLLRITSFSLQAAESSQLLVHFDRVSLWLFQFMPKPGRFLEGSDSFLQHSFKEGAPSLEPKKQKSESEHDKAFGMPETTDAKQLDKLIEAIVKKEIQQSLKNEEKTDKSDVKR